LIEVDTECLKIVNFW